MIYFIPNSLNRFIYQTFRKLNAIIHLLTDNIEQFTKDYNSLQQFSSKFYDGFHDKMLTQIEYLII